MDTNTHARHAGGSITPRRRGLLGQASSRSRRADGQVVVEFALIVPIFLILLMAVLEFGFVFNALLSINFATRDAALIAAEAGSTAGVDGAGRDVGADCLILQKIDEDVTAPADSGRITEVRIYRSNLAGTQMGSIANVYRRGGPTICTYASGTITVPYALFGSVGYAGTTRCDVLAGCPNDSTGVPHPGLDTIGVQVAYQHTWRTPFSSMIGGGGTGFSMLKGNATRMEPVL
jgi:TadE-like protein